MKLIPIFIFFIFALFNAKLAICQDTSGYAEDKLVIAKTEMTVKDIKKGFRVMQRKASSREEKKTLRTAEKEYFVLLEQKKQQYDSIQVQKAKIESMMKANENRERESAAKVQELRAEIDSLRAIMTEYIRDIDRVNTFVNDLKKGKDYYFKLEEFVEPKIYFYYNTINPNKSQYWKLSSVPDSNWLITEGYTADFNQFEYFKEQYDSIGSKVVEYIYIENSDSTFFNIGTSNEVYRWTLTGKYAYSVLDSTPNYERSCTKTRSFSDFDSLEVLGSLLKVVRFEDAYNFYEGEEQVFAREQHSFYAKEYGLVRFLRIDRMNQTNETYLLKAILTEEEWTTLQQ